MADPLLGQQQYIAEWDADTDELSLTGTTPGPAGTHEVAFAGVTVAFDAADLGVVNLVTVDGATRLAGDPTAHRLLERLVGDEIVDALVEVIGRAPARRRRLGEPTTDRRGMRGVGADMARLALAMSTAGSAGLTRDEWALAELEAMTLAHRLDLHDNVPDFAERVHAASEQIVASPMEVLFDPWGPNASGVSSITDTAARVCADACRLLADELLAARLQRVATRLRARGEEQVAAAMSAPMPSAAAGGAAARRPITVALDSLPNLVAAQEPSINRTSGDEYEVCLPGWAERADGWWVRGFRGADNVPLAAVPMAGEDDDAVARFLITERDAASLVIDIVSDPAEPRASEQIAAFRAAIATGKRAAQLERLYRPHEARAAWRRAGDLHLSAGDSWRAKTAQSRSTGVMSRNRGQRALTIDPVIADLLGPNT